MDLIKEYLTNRRLTARAGVTIAILAVYVAGIFVPGPGVNTAVIGECEAAMQGYFGVINVFGAGGLVRLSPFALGVLPFITMSIILVLATRVLPFAKGLDSSLRARTLVLVAGGLVLLVANAVAAAVRSTTPGALIGGCDEPILAPGSASILLASGAMIVGSVALLGMSEVINRHGVGSGTSVLIAAGIALGIPFELRRLGGLNGPVFMLLAAALMVTMFWTVNHISKLRRDLEFQTDPETEPVQVRRYEVPLNISGSMPIILANVLIYLPSMIASMAPQSGLGKWISTHFSGVTSPAFVIALIALTTMFCFYHVIVTYDADAVARAMADRGLFPKGEQQRSVASSTKAVDAFLLRVTCLDAVFLSALALIPSFAAWVLGISGSLPLGGSSIIVLVLVAAAIGTHAQAVADYEHGRPLKGGALHPDELKQSLFSPRSAPTTPTDR